MEKPFRVWKGVYQVGSSGLSDGNDCCVYLVDGGGDLALIDSGAGESFERLCANVRALGYGPENIKTVVATHLHIDHVGSLHQFRERYGAWIVAHRLDAAAIESGRGTGAEFYGVDYTPCPVDQKVEGSQDVLKCGRWDLTLLHIPGHTPGSIALYMDMAGKRVLFGQDIHGPYLARWGGDPAAAVDSLRKLADLKADILCEGHYGVIQPAVEVEKFIGGYLFDVEK